jgi:hypothetical protein
LGGLSVFARRRIRLRGLKVHLLFKGVHATHFNSQTFPQFKHVAAAFAAKLEAHRIKSVKVVRQPAHMDHPSEKHVATSK